MKILLTSIIAVAAAFALTACEENKQTDTSPAIKHTQTATAADQLGISDSEMAGAIAFLADKQCGTLICAGRFIVSECYGISVSGDYRGKMRYCLRDATFSLMTMLGYSHSEAKEAGNTTMNAAANGWDWYYKW